MAPLLTQGICHRDPGILNSWPSGFRQIWSLRVTAIYISRSLQYFFLNVTLLSFARHWLQTLEDKTISSPGQGSFYSRASPLNVYEATALDLSVSPLYLSRKQRHKPEMINKIKVDIVLCRSYLNLNWIHPIFQSSNICLVHELRMHQNVN